MNTVVIVQARMGSSRLPGKVLKKILGRPMLDLQVERLSRVRNANEIIVATSDAFGDNAIVELCNDLAVPCFRGSEDDVLSRYYDAARAAHAGVVVRVTGDCPLIDPDLINKIIDEYTTNRKNIDYCSNTLQRTFPRGLDTEVFSMKALEEAHAEATEQPDREHVTTYIWRQPERFRLRAVCAENDYSDHRWTVDTVQDLVLVRKLFEELYPHDPLFTWRDCLELMERNPDWRAINAEVEQKVVF